MTGSRDSLREYTHGVTNRATNPATNRATNPATNRATNPATNRATHSSDVARPVTRDKSDSGRFDLRNG
jgi:hypothetical protein